MIRVEALAKIYTLGGQEIRAVDGVSFAMAEGEAVALLGASGSGKSTLLHLLGALDHPSAGRIEIGGRDISGLSRAERARYRSEMVGFVFQAFHLFPHFTALENVAVPLAIQGVRRADRLARAAKRLEQVGLADRLHHRPSELSGGQQQRVAIARALAASPRLLLADEPTGNLDSKTGEEMMDLFLDLAKRQRMTLVLVTHEAAIATRVGRVIRLKDGKIDSDERAAPRAVVTAVGGPSPEENAPASTPARASRTARVLDLAREAARGLARRKARTALTSAGIAIGAFAITLMIGLGIGLHDFIVTQAEAVNDPLSLRVYNAAYTWDDVVGNRLEQLGRIPVPLEEKTFERLAKIRAGYDPFTPEAVGEIAAVPGVESVRPRTYVVIDGVRLVPAGQEAGAAGERSGAPEEFGETFYLAFALVRGSGTPFRLASGTGFESDSAGAGAREVILSYQYAEAWEIEETDDLVGREVELLFPALGEYSQWNWMRPDQVRPRYRAYRARVAGVTAKSILSSAVVLPPGFGEEVADYQFGRGGTGIDEEFGDTRRMDSILQLIELARLLSDDQLARSLEAWTPAEQELWRSLERVRRIPDALGAGGRDAAPDLAALLGALGELERVRRLLGDPELSRALDQGPDPKRRLGRALSSILRAAGSGAASPTAAGGEAPSASWGSTLRVRVAAPSDLEPVRARLEKMGYRVRTFGEEVAAIGRVFAVLDAFLSSFGMIALFVAAFGIVNTLSMAVLERKCEIGILKALGATRGTIRTQFALEAAGIGLAGGLAGTLVAAMVGHWFNESGIALVVAEWRGFPFYQSPAWLVAASIAFATLVGLVAGLYPAHRAARLDPVAALRSE